MLFTSLSADEFQLNSKKAYIPKCIHKCININECTSVVIRDFYVHFLKKKSRRSIQESSRRSLLISPRQTKEIECKLVSIFFHRGEVAHRKQKREHDKQKLYKVQ